MPGFIEVDRKCKIRYGQKCKQNSTKSLCDSHALLKCSVRNICECAEFKVYNNETETCVGLVGARCNSKEPPVYYYVTRTHELCVDGAFCSSFRGSSSNYGLCKCKSGWKLNADRTCSKTELVDKDSLPKPVTNKDIPDA